MITTSDILSIAPELHEMLERWKKYGMKIREMSLNLMKDGSLIAYDYIGGFYCHTNRYQGHLIEKQAHFVRPVDGTEWRLEYPGCGCAQFEQLELEDLPENWLDEIKIKRPSSPMLKPAGSGC